MKLKIKIKSPYEIKITSKGDWFDLKYVGEDITFDGFENIKTNYTDAEGKKHYKKKVTPKVQLLDLGVAMQLPKGFEAIVAPRSSTPKHYGILCANSIGIIDNTYNGNGDIWMFPAFVYGNKSIKYGDRICQFRIQLSQKATVLQKLKWLFTSGIKFIYVDKLENDNRGGIGSTGK